MAGAGTRRREAEARLASVFWEETVRRGRCAECGWRPGRGDGPWLEADHVIPKAVIRDRCRRFGHEPTLADIWDPRNGRCLCAEPAPRRCHTRHTNRVRLASRRSVRDCVWEFARELDARYAPEGAEPFTAYLEDTYPAESEAAA